MPDTTTPTRTYNLGDLLEIVAESVPDRLAVVAGDVRYTFREFDERTNQVARALLDLGLEPEAKVAMYSWNRSEWAEVFFGAFKARVVPININYRYVAHELEYVLENSDAEVLIFERSFAPIVDEIAPKLPKLKHRIVIEDGSDADAGDAARYDDVVGAQDTSAIGNQRSDDDLYFLYTGGTTGMPKGVMWRHEDLFFAALSSGLGPEPVTSPQGITERSLPEEFARPSLIIAPLMHGAAQWGMCGMMFAGAGVCLYTERGLDPHAVWALAEREKCMGLTLVGDAMARPLADALAEKPDAYDLSGMFRIGSGGGVFSPAVQGQLKELIPHVQVMDAYGASETGAGGMSAEGGPRRFVVGPELQVIDDDLRPVAPGEVGRLARRGHIPLGYYKDEAKTAATFPTDADGNRWSVPGDFATVDDDGIVTLLGRGSQCINTGGEKVYPEEVEEALKSHPDVFDALVVGVPDDRWGERVVAVIAARGDARPTVEDLSAHCRQTIAGYKTPRAVTFVESIKRSPAGKADYRWAKDTASADAG
ncbi:acyl-CoA synthetase [Rhabdothermincola salaria]|uniref:acyl-CoA synthetase n=1 Tax=Rhabdothermincola salaria TaxID=2903142 RepID=UPI001E4B0323|nr:acyl-CoA synthetase [Rhabdothermincola salaria]MCD9624849.1 acyl-CoA synthetase [Rhabdothermincola salaria]